MISLCLENVPQLYVEAGLEGKGMQVGGSVRRRYRLWVNEGGGFCSLTGQNQEPRIADCPVLFLLNRSAPAVGA